MTAESKSLADRNRTLFDLMSRYAHYIDDDKLEEWLNLFSEDCEYIVGTKENSDRGMSLPLIVCDSRRSLQDRITALRTAQVYNLHYDRHIVTNCMIVSETDTYVELHASFLVLQTDLVEGKTSVFVSGKYEDKIQIVEGQPKFRSKRILLDTHSVPNLLSTPI